MKHNFLKFLCALMVCITLSTCGLALTGCGDNNTQAEVKSLTLNKTSITLSQYASETLVATTDPANATVTWYSLDETKVVVDNNGTIRAVGVTAYPVAVVAFAGTKIAKCEVMVVPGDNAYQAEPSVSFSADDLQLDATTNKQTYTDNISLSDGVLWATANTASDGFIEADTNSKTIDGISYTQRLKLSGKGSTEARSIKLVLQEGAKVVIHCVSSSSDNTIDINTGLAKGERTVNLYDENYQKVSGQYFTLEPSSTPTVETLIITTAGTYYIGTETGGLNIYGIYIYYTM